MISEFYRPLCVSAFRQYAGHVEYRSDPVTRRGKWLTYGPEGRTWAHIPQETAQGTRSNRTRCSCSTRANLTSRNGRRSGQNVRGIQEGHRRYA
jgi:hypothetical protein